MNRVSSEPGPSPSDVGDRHRRFLAHAMLGIGTVYALSAARHLVGSDTAAVLKALEFVSMAIGLAFLAPVFIWKFRTFRQEDWRLYTGRDGFVADALARAHVASWGATFMLLAVLALFANDTGSLSPKFFLETALATMLLVFALVFLYLTRASEEEEDRTAGRA